MRTNVAIAVALFVLHQWFFGHYVGQIERQTLPEWFWSVYDVAFYGVYALSLFIGLLHWPLFAAAVASSRSTSRRKRVDRAWVRIFYAGLTVILLAPPMAFAKRVISLMVALIILIGLNELSKLGLSVLAPPWPR